MSEQKMITAAKTFDIIAKVCKGIFEAVGIVCVIFAALVLLFGEKMYELGSFTLDMAYIKLHLSENVLPSVEMIEAFIVVLLAALGVIFFLTSYGIRQFRSILAPMKEGRPFEANVSGRLRKIAWTTLAGGAVLSITSFVECMLLTKAYPLDQIFSSPAIEKVEFVYTMDFGFVFIFCVIMFLSYIFDYGQKLQRESDETL